MATVIIDMHFKLVLLPSDDISGVYRRQKFKRTLL